MYSLLPALVSALFLGYGVYVVAVKGVTRVSAAFFLLCLATFCWQATWAVLFQARDPAWIDALVRFGYLLILFLPTSLYAFLVEISGREHERRWVAVSAGFAAVLGGFVLFTDLFVAGWYDYFFGPYPKAGPLHPLHVVQTVVVVNRGLWITWRESRIAADEQRTRLRLCVASLLVYFFAAVDYLCNYGFGFYPPGVVFIAISLGLVMVAVIRYHLMSPLAVAATVAHEMRTPLASIRMQAEALSEWMPQLARGYELALGHGLMERDPASPDAERIAALPRGIASQVDRSNVMIDMMLASARMEQIDTGDFARCSMAACVREAVEAYPFARNERARVHVQAAHDFAFRGSQPLMVCVLFNLLKNSLYAMQAAGKGEIAIALAPHPGGGHVLTFRDTASGIPAATLPKIFDTYFTTKRSRGAGIGLAFCKRAVEAFGGTLACESVEGEHTTFTMVFPALD